MIDLTDNRDKVKILQDEANKYIDRIERVPLYPIDKYQLVYFCLDFLRELGFVYSTNSMHKLVIRNDYHNPDVESSAEHIELLYYELDQVINSMAIYYTDRASILFQFREMIFRFGIKARYYLDTNNLKIDV